MSNAMAEQKVPQTPLTSHPVILIANQLANEGKKPTVALVKGKLSSSLPLFEIINVLKTWKHNPELCSEIQEPQSLKTAPELNDNEVTDTELIKKVIDEKLAPIKKDIADIKALLSTISEQLAK